jgi:hypothetical protein
LCFVGFEGGAIKQLGPGRMSSLVRLILEAFAARTDDAQYGSCGMVPTARGLIGGEDVRRCRPG